MASWMAGELRILSNLVRELREEKEKEGKTKNTKQNFHVPALWRRKPEDVTNEEYAMLYKKLSDDSEDHLAVKHMHFDNGNLEFRALLFVPQTVCKKKRNNIKLSERRVFLRDNCDELMSEWLNPVVGVVDSEALPLNLSCEDLQQNKILRDMKKLVQMCLEMLFDVAKKDHTKIYEQLGKNIKLSLHGEGPMREEVAKLLRFHTSKSGSAHISYQEYVDRMKQDQNDIYYIMGESLDEITISPFLDAFRKKDLEVLYMMDAEDELMVQPLKKFDDKRLREVDANADDEQSNLKEYVDRRLEEFRLEMNPKLDQMLKLMLDTFSSTRT